VFVFIYQPQLTKETIFLLSFLFIPCSSFYGTYLFCFICLSFRKKDTVKLLKIWNLTDNLGLTILAVMKIGNNYLILSQRVSLNGLVCHLHDWCVLCIKHFIDNLILYYIVNIDFMNQNQLEVKLLLNVKMRLLETLLKSHWKKHQRSSWRLVILHHLLASLIGKDVIIPQFHVLLNARVLVGRNLLL